MKQKISVARRRFLRVVLCGISLVLVPVLVVTTPSVAQAAVNRGVWTTASLSADLAPVGSLKCNANFRYQVTGTTDYRVELGNGVCLAPYSTQLADGGSPYTVWVNGVHPTTQAVCGFSFGGTFTNHPDDSWSNELGAMTSATSGALTYGCVINQWCVTVGGGFGGSQEYCSAATVPLPVGAPATSSTCTYGTPQSAWGVFGDSNGNGSGASWTPTGTTFNVSARITVPTSQGSGAWGAWIKWRRKSDGAMSWRDMSVSSDMSDATVTPTKYYSWPGANGTRAGAYGIPTGQTADALLEIVGIQVYNRSMGYTISPLADRFNGTLYPGNAQGDLGRTEPGKCFFYFGPKEIDITTDTTDEPYGAYGDPALVDGPNPPAPAGVAPPDPNTGGEGETACTFSWSNPSGWASAGICALVHLMSKAVGLLGSIVSAVLALPGQIMGLLAGILTDLFVPDQAATNAHVQGLKDMWDNTTIGNYKTALTGQNFALAQSGCGGVPVQTNALGVPIDFSIGEACSGTMATVAGICKLLLTASLVLFGSLACLRALGSGFGWNPGVGKGEAT